MLSKTAGNGLHEISTRRFKVRGGWATRWHVSPSIMLLLASWHDNASVGWVSPWFFEQKWLEKLCRIWISRISWNFWSIAISLTGYKAFKQPWCTLNFICLQWTWVYNKHTWATKRTLVTFLIHWLFNRDAYNWDIINPITGGILQTPMQPKQPGFSSFFPWTENGDLVFSHTWT